MTPDLLEWEHGGQTHIGTAADFIGELTYANYRYNRQISPEITPERWRNSIPAFTEAMEARYQADNEKPPCPRSRS